MNIDTEHQHIAFELRMSNEAKSMLRELGVPVWLLRRAPIFSFVQIENSDDKRSNRFTSKRWFYHSIANSENEVMLRACEKLPYVLSKTIRFHKDVLPSTYLRRYELTLKARPQITAADIPMRVIASFGFEYYGEKEKQKAQQDRHRLKALLTTWAHSSKEQLNSNAEIVRHLYKKSIFIRTDKYKYIHSEQLFRYQIEFDVTNCGPVETELTLFLMANLSDIHFDFVRSIEYEKLLEERLPAITKKPMRKTK